MKYIKLFDSVQGLETAAESSTVDFLGMAFQGNTPVIKTVTPPPTS